METGVYQCLTFNLLHLIRQTWLSFSFLRVASLGVLHTERENQNSYRSRNKLRGQKIKWNPGALLGDHLCHELFCPLLALDGEAADRVIGSCDFTTRLSSLLLSLQSP